MESILGKGYGLSILQERLYDNYHLITISYHIYPWELFLQQAQLVINWRLRGMDKVTHDPTDRMGKMPPSLGPWRELF